MCKDIFILTVDTGAVMRKHRKWRNFGCHFFQWRYGFGCFVNDWVIDFFCLAMNYNLTACFPSGEILNVTVPQLEKEMLSFTCSSRSKRLR